MHACNTVQIWFKSVTWVHLFYAAENFAASFPFISSPTVGLAGQNRRALRLVDR